MLNIDLLKDDRRSQYRVAPEPGQELQVAMITSDGQRIADEVIDVTIDGIGTRFPYDGTPELQVGDRARLRVMSPMLGHEVEIEADVVSSVSVAPLRFYSFRFDDGAEHFSDAPDEFYRLFNRRAAFRGAEPDPNRPIGVVVFKKSGSADPVRLNAVLRNISARGLGVRANSELDTLLSANEPVDVSVALFDEGRSLRLVAMVRHSSEQNGWVNYGMQIDTRQTEDYLGQAEDIAEFILSRMADELDNPQSRPH